MQDDKDDSDESESDSFLAKLKKESYSYMMKREKIKKDKAAVAQKIVEAEEKKV